MTSSLEVLAPIRHIVNREFRMDVLSKGYHTFTCQVGGIDEIQQYGREGQLAVFEREKHTGYFGRITARPVGGQIAQYDLKARPNNHSGILSVPSFIIERKKVIIWRSPEYSSSIRLLVERNL